MFLNFVLQSLWQNGIYKQSRPRSDCSWRSSLIRVHTVCHFNEYFKKQLHKKHNLGKKIMEWSVWNSRTFTVCHHAVFKWQISMEILSICVYNFILKPIFWSHSVGGNTGQISLLWEEPLECIICTLNVETVLTILFIKLEKNPDGSNGCWLNGICIDLH